MTQESKQEQPWRPEPLVVGGTPEEKQKALDEMMRIFREQTSDIWPERIRDILRRLEYPKAPNEEAAFRFANQQSNDIVERYGGAPYDYSLPRRKANPPLCNQAN